MTSVTWVLESEIFRAGGLTHSTVNTGTEVFKCIVMGQRLDYDVADYPHLGKRIYRMNGRPNDLVDLEQITHPIAGKKIEPPEET